MASLAERLALALLVLMLLVVGCAPAGWQPLSRSTPAIPQTPYPVSDNHVDATNGFGFRLLEELLAAGEGENVFISPLSVSLALSMTLNGAEGETEQAMMDALGLADMTQEEINEAAAGLRQALAEVDAVELAIANSIWAREGVDFHEAFLQVNRDYYRARVEALPFDDEAVEIMNEWVAENTNGKIDEIIEAPIDPAAIMFLLNAVYFKGDWQVPFDEEHTRDEPFYLAAGPTVEVPLMYHREESFPYYDGEGYQAISLPYGEQGSMSMVILLPDEETSLNEFLQGLDATWHQATEGMTPQAGVVALPRFKVEYEANLNDPLKAMGMAIAFDKDNADFSGMRPIPPNVYIGNVQHKTYVEVNEKGTEAAAATSVEIEVESALMIAYEFIADHPFFYAIRDNESGAILFAGVMMNPTAE
jgi:serpin B